MASQIHVGDIGTTLIVTVLEDGAIVDISSATSLEITIKKPNGTTETKTGVFTTDGTDGRMQYISIAGDFDQPGNYRIQGKVDITGGTYYTSVGSFKVHCNL
jgi:5-hydroxyisourate hydrolase-like protein (transthyretin family)